MDFYWNVFTKSGSIDAYLGHVEYKKLAEGLKDEYGEHKGLSDK